MTPEEFVIEYLKENYETSVVDRDFHEAIAQYFDWPVRVKMYGASPCPAAMKVLTDMYQAGVLTRQTVGLVGMPSGFPKWVYSYTLRAS